MKPEKTSFQVQVGTRTFRVVLRDGLLYLDDEAYQYSLEPVSEHYYLLLLNGRSVPVFLEPSSNGVLRLTVGGRRADVRVQNEKDQLLNVLGSPNGKPEKTCEVRAPMSGLVHSVAVKPGEVVEAGDGLVVLEAMKMENELRAPVGGIVKRINIREGDTVSKNDLLIELESAT
jgi:biotin carboxyl carrier protein